MIIKAKFLDADGNPRGREYTYGCHDSVTVGEVVYTAEGKSLVITATDLPEEVAAQWGDGLKYLYITPPESEQQAIPIEADEIAPAPDMAQELAHDLIEIKQLPIIIERLEAMGRKIDEDIAAALELPCSQETVKLVKEYRARLNNDLAALEERRMQVKKAVMQPYDDFLAVYKRCVTDKYKGADTQLKQKIDNVESGVKDEKYQEVKEYFDEYRLSRGVDFVNIDTWKPNVTLSASLKSLKAEGKAFVDRIADDLALIETQEHKTEILVEYRRSLSLSQAITAVATRHKAIEEQKRREAEDAERRAQAQESAQKVEAAVQAAPIPTVSMPAPPIAAPVPQAEQDPVRTLAFKVTAPISKLRELKRFLEDGGYQYE